MKQRVSPGFYNSEMESHYFRLFLQYRKLKKMNRDSEDFKNRIVRFELNYYKISKMNKILLETNKKKDEFVYYLEPTFWKNKVDKGAKELGIKPYEELDKKEDDFIMISF